MFIYVYDFFSWKLINISLKNRASTLWKGIVELCVSLGSTAPLQVAATHPTIPKCLVQLTFLHFLIELPSECERSELRKCKLVLTATFVTVLVRNAFQDLETAVPLVDVSTAAAISDYTGVKHRTTEIQLKFSA